MRLLCRRREWDAHKMRTGRCGRMIRKKLCARWSNWRTLRFSSTTLRISLSEMRAKARRLKQAQGGKLDLIIVDYLQLMSGGGKRFENRTQKFLRFRAD